MKGKDRGFAGQEGSQDQEDKQMWFIQARREEEEGTRDLVCQISGGHDLMWKGMGKAKESEGLEEGPRGLYRARYETTR